MCISSCNYLQKASPTFVYSTLGGFPCRCGLQILCSSLCSQSHWSVGCTVKVLLLKKNCHFNVLKKVFMLKMSSCRKKCNKNFFLIWLKNETSFGSVTYTQGSIDMGNTTPRFLLNCQVKWLYTLNGNCFLPRLNNPVTNFENFIKLQKLHFSVMLESYLADWLHGFYFLIIWHM